MDGKVYKRALVTCIAMLLLSIVLKLFGVQWFNLNTDIPLLQEIDKVVMNSIPLCFLYSFIFKFINGYLICSIANKNTKINILLLSIISCVSILLSFFLGNNILIFVYDFFSLYIICYNKCKFMEFIYVMLLNTIYQILSLFIKDLGIKLSYYGLINSVLYMIDYYIMLVITYLYLSKGGKSVCSIVQAFYSYLASKLWRKPSENYLNKDGK